MARLVPLTYVALIRFVQTHINDIITVRFFCLANIHFLPFYSRPVLNSENIRVNNNNIIIDCSVSQWCVPYHFEQNNMYCMIVPCIAGHLVFLAPVF